MMMMMMKMVVVMIRDRCDGADLSHEVVVIADHQTHHGHKMFRMHTERKMNIKALEKVANHKNVRQAGIAYLERRHE